jgi:hypothetical protein
MKKISFFLFALIVGISSCKKSGSGDNTPSPDGKTCRILTMATTQTGYSSFTWCYYNSSGNLLYTKSTSSFSPGDTSVGTQYQYRGEVLQYSWYNSSVNFSDTVFYYFDGSNKLVSKSEHNRTGTNLLSTKTDYFYNSANQVILTLARSDMDTIFTRVDSTIYTYTGNNVARYTLFERTGYGTVFNVTIDFSYDSMKNFYKAMGMPPDAFYYWSENNITRAKYADSTNALTTINYSKYNESGYPTEMTSTDNYSSQSPVSVVLTYQCK